MLDGRRGPAPKPAAVKKARGTATRKPKNREPGLAVGAPTLAAALSPAARAEARRLIAETMTLRVLTIVDRGVIESAASAYDIWQQAEADVRQRGITLEEPNVKGDFITKANPSTKIMSDAWRRYVAALCQLGLTPSARTRVNTSPSTQDDADPASRYLQ